MELRKETSHDLIGPHFPVFPTVEEVADLLAMAGDETIRLQQIARAIEGRPMIAAAVMRTVNAASLGTTRPIQSVRHALAMMGMERTRTILLEMQHEAREVKQRVSTARTSRIPGSR